MKRAILAVLTFSFLLLDSAICQDDARAEQPPAVKVDVQTGYMTATGKPIYGGPGNYYYYLSSGKRTEWTLPLSKPRQGAETKQQPPVTERKQAAVAEELTFEEKQLIAKLQEEKKRNQTSIEKQKQYDRDEKEKWDLEEQKAKLLGPEAYLAKLKEHEKAIKEDEKKDMSEFKKLHAETLETVDQLLDVEKAKLLFLQEQQSLTMMLIGLSERAQRDILNSKFDEYQKKLEGGARNRYEVAIYSKLLELVSGKILDLAMPR